MSCSCHGADGQAVLTARHNDQCSSCARKHVKQAWSKWGEFTYEQDNRDYVSAQLRDAADHMKYDHHDTALKCRDLAMVIEDNRDADLHDVADRLQALLDEVTDIFYEEHPEAKERLEVLEVAYER